MAAGEAEPCSAPGLSGGSQVFTALLQSPGFPLKYWLLWVRWKCMTWGSAGSQGWDVAWLFTHVGLWQTGVSTSSSAGPVGCWGCTTSV